MAKKKLLTEDEIQIQNQLRALKTEKLKVLEAEAKFREELQHRYRFKHYKWSREFFETTNRDVFLVAGNQLGKSSIQIRKVIEWATNVDLWPQLWATPPKLFWWVSENKEMINQEVRTKWIPDFLPRGSLKNHPQYGWKIEKDGRNVVGVQFNSGVYLAFKTFSQNAHDLQGATLDYVAVDEEMPEELYDELNFRRTAKNAYLSMCFTATRGQELWRACMEEVGTPKEKFKGAWKKCVSMWECQFFEDGSPSHFTPERIKRAIAMCLSLIHI